MFAELEVNMAQARTLECIAARQRDEEYYHGRPPLGFEKTDGRLVEDENYHRVVSILELHQKGEIGTRGQFGYEIKADAATTPTAGPGSEGQ